MIGITAFLVHFALSISADPRTPIILKVNGLAITTADVTFIASQQGIPEDERAEAEPKLIEQLIERQLIRALLNSKKIEPISDQLQFQVARAEEVIRKRGEDPQKLLAKLGYTPERLKLELGLPLAWQLYANQTITQPQIKEYFDRHRQELDGTRVRGSQIFLSLPKSPDETEVLEKKQKLVDVKKEVLAGHFSFAEAAKNFSEAPTRERGGDVGLFTWRRGLPAVVSEAAFSLKVNDISEPIVSTFGVHLIQVTERHPGELSLEDVRPVIVERLSQELWVTTAENARKTAKIEWMRK